MNNFKSRSNRRIYLYISLLILIVIISFILLLLYTQRNKSPVPSKISKEVTYPVYYTDPKKLPSGYNLVNSSFSSGGGAVIFTVNGPKSTKLIFSEQEKPTTLQLQNFNSTRIPLHTTYTAAAGIATIGAIGNNSVISLPTKDNTWLLITGPYFINQKQLDQVLNSLTK